MKRPDMMHKIAAFATAGMMLGASSSARAAGLDINAVAKNIVKSVSSFPDLVTTVCYLGGIGLGVAGIFKLKDHVDAPGQVRMKDGVARLMAGGGLLSAPYIASAMTHTVKGGSTAAVAPDTNFGAMNY